jgi:FkbM family methyltransferase
MDASSHVSRTAALTRGMPATTLTRMSSVAKWVKDQLRGPVNRLGRNLVHRTAPRASSFDVQRLMFDGQDLVIFDVGGHYGETSEEYRRFFPIATIHAFEPTPASFEIMQRKFAKDRQHHLHQVALSDQAGSAVFTVNQTDSTNSLLATEDGVHEHWRQLVQTEGTVEVKTQTLDAFCDTQGIKTIDILKLDVQGAENRVLKGAQQMLARGAIRAVFLELIVTRTYVGQAEPGELLTMLRQAGFTVVDIYDVSRNGLVLLQFDLLFAQPPQLAAVTARSSQSAR